MKKTSIKTEPLFFLFTCVKDGRDYIEKLFDSLINQTRKNFKHYIYEDGSTEPLTNIIDEYIYKVSKLDNGYDVIYEKNVENIGLNYSTKHCIEKCDAPYFIWIDCDNWVDNHFFEELEKTVRKNKNAIVIRTELYDSDVNHISKYNKSILKGRKKTYQLNNFLYDNYYFSFFAVNFKSYVKINKNVFFVNKRWFFNDRQVLFSCLMSLGRCAFSAKSIGYFMVKKDSESSCYETHNIEDRFNGYKLIYENITINYNFDISCFLSARLLMNEILAIKTSDNKKARLLFKKRIKILKNGNLPKSLWYKKGNSIYWRIILFFSWIKGVFIRIKR